MDDVSGLKKNVCTLAKQIEAVTRQSQYNSNTIEFIARKMPKIDVFVNNETSAIITVEDLCRTRRKMTGLVDL